jgi:DNA-binding transcriptional MerR regulator
MNEGAESIPSMVTRKKKRGSRFRYSSRKDLARSKLRRTAKAGGSELASVRKALSYPSALSSGSAAGSEGQHYLDRVEEHDGERIEICLNNSLSDGAFTESVSNITFSFCLIVI